MLDSEFYPLSRREAIEEQVDKAAADKGMDRNVRRKTGRSTGKKCRKKNKRTKRHKRKKNGQNLRRDGLMRKNRRRIQYAESAGTVG